MSLWSGGSRGGTESRTIDVQTSPESSSAGVESARSGQQQNFTSDEHVVKETKTRTVPTYVDTYPRSDPHPMYPRADLHPLRLSTLSAEPVTVRWDYVTPDSISPERKLQQMDHEMQRLAGEMSQLWGQSPSYRRPDFNPLWGQSPTYRHPEMNRAWNQSFLDREAEMNRLWNQQSGAYRETGLAQPLLPSFEVPRGFVRLSSNPAAHASGLVPARADHLWGADAHAESWRQKENFHIDNPVVKGRDGQSQFRLEFDLRQFNADEIEVTTDGPLLTVQAKHEDEAHGKKVRREYFRQCTIPRDVAPRSIISQLSQSGILSVYAPLSAEVEEKAQNIRIKAK